MSARVRDSVLRAITRDDGLRAPATQNSSLAAAVRSVSAALADDAGTLTPGEKALMRELLGRLADER